MPIDVRTVSFSYQQKFTQQLQTCFSIRHLSVMPARWVVPKVSGRKLRPQGMFNLQVAVPLLRS